MIYKVIVFLPIIGALIAGLLGRGLGSRPCELITTAFIGISAALSWVVLSQIGFGAETVHVPVLRWVTSGQLDVSWGLRIDTLTGVMLVVVNTVSFLVHLYSIGYMHEDDSRPRFFAYLSLFTFAMLMLVMSNNFLQLFFGWEAVGLVSYLLIGFWHNRPTAIYANLKAFLVNRVGDFGFLLGIALVLMYFGTLDYAAVFGNAKNLAANTIEIIPGAAWSLMTVICILLFIGAMGKSAQFPLHVWLPDSMEGPTPISALIHAATMVTAGIFMVARMSPLFELSETALSVVMVIGAITALFMALIAMVQYDIKRVVAYSTLSQLGYMTVALGASAYSVAIFHLMTHAFFKAVLFLGAGSVIIALHHEQDMRKMGGLRKYMPITYLTVLAGALANAGFPPFAGFFSKDTIIEAVHASQIPGAGFAYFATLLGVLIGGFYSFRLVFFAFHGKARFADPHDLLVKEVEAERAHEAGHDHGGHGHELHTPHESPAVVTLPLILLAIPSLCAGWIIGDFVYGSYFGNAIYVAPGHAVVAELAKSYHGVVPMIIHGLTTAPFWFALTGLAAAWYLYIARPGLAPVLRRKAGWLVTILMEKYGFDRFNDWFFAGGARKLGSGLWKGGDVAVIDNIFVNGSARLVGWFSGVIRHCQSGYIYHYAFTMIIGILLLLTMIFI